MRSFKKASPNIIIGLGILILLILIVRLWNFTVDDSFITFRYSANLAAGYGPTWNPGGEPTEGYSTFLWMLIMTIPHLLGIDAVIFSKILGILLTIGYLFFVYQFTIKITDFLGEGQRKLPAATAVLALCCYTPTAVHAISGMGTALITFLITAFLYTLTVYVKQPTKPCAFMLAGFGLLSGLARPEMNLLVLTGLASAYFLVDKTARLTFLQAIGLLFVLPGAAYFGWRLAYYRQMFPLPFYIKVTTQKFMTGRYYVATLWGNLLSALGVPLISSVQELKKSLIPAILAALSIFIFYLFPIPIMAYGWRYLHPVLPLVFAFGGLGIGVLFNWINQANAYKPELQIVSIIVLVACVFLIDLPTQFSEYIDYGRHLQNAHIPLGKVLAQYDGDDESPLLVIGDAGAVPYYAGWQTIDSFGLNDNTIAYTNEHDPAYIMSQKPDVIILISGRLDSFEPKLDWEAELYESSLDAGMERVAAYEFHETYYLWVMAVPETPIGEFIAGYQKAE